MTDRRSRRSYFAFACIVLHACAESAAPNGSACNTGSDLSPNWCASLSGTVVGPTGAPAAGLRILGMAINDSVSGSPSWPQATSGADGRFSLVWTWLIMNPAIHDSAKVRLRVIGPRAVLDSIDIHVHFYNVRGPAKVDSLRWTLQAAP